MNQPRTWGILLGLMLVVAGLALATVEGAWQLQEAQAKGELLSAVVDRLGHGATGANGVHEAAPEPRTNPLVAERVELPEVEGHFWLTFLYQDSWQQDPETVRLHNMFLNDPRLVEMRRRCRVNNFKQMDPYMVERWQKYVGKQAPMIVLQAPDGQVCFKASRGNIPGDANELIAQLQQSLDERFRRPCPGPDPSPAPVQPQPEPAVPVSPLPDTVGPAEQPRDAGDPLWLLAVLGISGIAIGVVLARKRR